MNKHKSETFTGGSASYYEIHIELPQNIDRKPYIAECIDIVRALKLTPDEFNAFKAIWRTAAARLGKTKKYNTALYDAEKVQFAGERMVREAEFELEKFKEICDNIQTG